MHGPNNWFPKVLSSKLCKREPMKWCLDQLKWTPLWKKLWLETLTLMVRRSIHIPKIKIILHVICKISWACFWVFWACWSHQSKMIVSTYGKLWCFPASKKSTAFLTSFLRYYKDIIKFSGYFRQVWPST